MLTRRSLLSLTAVSAFAQRNTPLPNFIILFADDMGYGDLSCYGHPTIRTPHLDRMAEEGMRFTSFYAAAPFCTPSRVGLLTGRYPIRAGLPNNLGPDSKGGLPLSEKLLPQILKTRGYKTMAIGKWHLGHDPEEYLPTHRGFDSYLGLLYSNDMIPPFVKTEHPLDLYRDTKPIERMNDQSHLTERYTEEAIRFIKSSEKNPFLLYLPYAMPHLPISASSREGKSRAGLYGDVIETIDWSAGEILKTLKAQGIDNNTMVIFASDNGPWQDLPMRMLQRGNEQWHTGSRSLLRESKGKSYEGGPRVPCIARWPGVIPQRQISADMACSMDLFATITKAAGSELPTDRVYDGFDLMPHLKGAAKSPRELFYFFRGRWLEAVREGSWKFRYAPDINEHLQTTTPAVRQLFNLDHDPAELYNQVERHPDIASRLEAKLKAFGQEMKADLPK